MEPFEGASTSAGIYAEPLTVGQVSNITIIAQNQMPLEKWSTVLIKVPETLSMEAGPINVKISGVDLNSDPKVYVDLPSREIWIRNFNTKYLQQLTQSYFYIHGLRNPSSSEPTAPFTLHFLTSTNHQIESTSPGQLRSQPAVFTNASLDINFSEIALPSVFYTFTL